MMVYGAAGLPIRLFKCTNDLDQVYDWADGHILGLILAKVAPQRAWLGGAVHREGGFGPPDAGSTGGKFSMI